MPVAMRLVLQSVPPESAMMIPSKRVLPALDALPEMSKEVTPAAELNTTPPERPEMPAKVALAVIVRVATPPAIDSVIVPVNVGHSEHERPDVEPTLLMDPDTIPPVGDSVREPVMPKTPAKLAEAASVRLAPDSPVDGITTRKEPPIPASMMPVAGVDRAKVSSTHIVGEQAAAAISAKWLNALRIVDIKVAIESS